MTTLDRTTVLAGIEYELSAFAGLVSALDEGDLNRPTRCDGWTVRHVAGHVVGIVVDVTEGRLDGQGTPAVTGRQASERADRSGVELAGELETAVPTLLALLGTFPDDAWAGPSLIDPSFTLGFGVEAIWYDAFLHSDDIRSALAQDSARGDGLRCAVHHVAGYLDHRGWTPTTLALDGMDRIDIRGGGDVIKGDPLQFVLAATGRLDAAAVGLDPAINVYA